MAKYVYPAIFSPSDDGGFTVAFPDVPGCYTEDDDLAGAIEQAEDALCLMLYDIEEREEAVPTPSALKDVRAEKDDIVSLVSCDTLEYRKFFDKRAVKKTLTIPNWLNSMAERSDINFSAVLQEALMEKLHLH